MGSVITRLRRRLDYRLTALLVGISVLLVGVAGTGVIFQRHERTVANLVDDSRQELALAAEGVSQSLINDLIADDFAGMESKLTLFRSLPAITRVEIYEDDGSAVMALQRGQGGARQITYTLDDYVGQPEHGFMGAYPEPIYCHPLRVNETTLGWLRVSAEYPSHSAAIRTSLTQSVLGSALLWMVLGGLCWQLVIQARFRRKLERRLASDPLTGAMSRYGFNRHYADGEREEPLALFLLDLDNFKAINDSYGHDAGDHALVAMTEAIRRDFVGLRDVVRLGGDEFVLLAPAEDWRAVKQQGQQLLQIFERLSIPLADASLPMRCTAGGALLDADDNLSTRLSQADLALRRAKENGKTQIGYADQSFLQAEGRRGTFLDHAMVRRGIEQGGIRHYVQPLVDVVAGRTIGYESLLRWHLDDGQILLPGQFLQVYHEVIREPDMLSQAEADRRALLEQAIAHGVEMMAFNMRIEELSRAAHYAHLIESLGRENLRHIELVIEISEAGMPRYLQRETGGALSGLEAIRSGDIKLALDDFGVQESNLVRMLELDIDQLKLDRSLIEHVVENPKSRQIITSIVGLCAQFDILLVGEGVESARQSEVLADLGVHIQQGFYLGRPAEPMTYFDPNAGATREPT